MPAYHSAFNDVPAVQEVCGVPVYPLKTRARGPAPTADLADPTEDVVEEAVRLFRANVLFKNFELKGNADKLLVYLTLFIHLCVKKAAAKPAKAEGLKELQSLATSNHLIPGEAGWPLAGVIPAPKTSAEQELLRSYFRQLRETVVAHLSTKLYSETDAALNKHWAMFAKRKFMGREFPG